MTIDWVQSIVPGTYSEGESGASIDLGEADRWVYWLALGGAIAGGSPADFYFEGSVDDSNWEAIPDSPEPTLTNSVKLLQGALKSPFRYVRINLDVAGDPVDCAFALGQEP